MTISAISATSVPSSTTVSPKNDKAGDGFQTVLGQALNERHGAASSADATKVAKAAAAFNASMAQMEQRSTVTIDGISVVTSGHRLDRRDGMSLLETVSASECQDLFSQLACYAEAHDPENNAASDGSQSMQNGPSMTVIESTSLGPLPDGATSVYMDIDPFRPVGQWTGDPILRQTSSEADDDAYYRRRTEQYMAVVGVERQLKQTYSDDIKLIYSHSDDGYIMLTPDDARYNEMNSAENAVQSIVNEVHRGFINEDAVADILADYGYVV